MFHGILFVEFLKMRALREKCLYFDFYLSAFSSIPSEYKEILRISPYSVQMQENTDQKNSEYGHFLRSAGNSYSGKLVKNAKKWNRVLHCFWDCDNTSLKIYMTNSISIFCKGMFTKCHQKIVLYILYPLFCYHLSNPSPTNSALVECVRFE